MTRRFCFILALITTPFLSAFSQGVELGGGLGLAEGDVFVTANAIFPSSWTLGEQTLLGNPEVAFYFLDDTPGFSQSLTIITLNALYPLGLEFANVYVGGGLLIGLYKGSFDEGAVMNGFDRNFDDTDIGLNAKAGVDLGKEDSKIIPWVEGGVHIKDGGGLYIQGGARLAL